MELSFFNPRAQKEADFLASFVARQRTLAFFLQQLRLTSPAQAARHLLVVAPRGYGKTSLLRRISIAVRNDAELNARFIALTFREEQHNIISLDVFWHNCLVSLMDAREDEDASSAELSQLQALCKQHVVRHALKREAQDGEPAWAALHAHCQQLGRRPVLLMDNLDTLLAGLPDAHQWGLRRVLQRDDGPFLLAAASRYPESTHDSNTAFFDFFRIQTLDRLSDNEVMQCLRTLAGHRGEAGHKVLQLINTDPGRISALNTLAGGNPRTLSVLYGVLEAHMSDDILSQLSSMLDTFTPWYQGRTAELPVQTGAVFDALALHWDPMTAAQLGVATGLDTPTVSSHLARLEKLNFAEAVALSSKGKGRNGYQVSERFYNIWYLMRHGARSTQRSVKFLTAFLQSCFNSTERNDMANRALLNPTRQPAYALALASSMRPSRLRDQLLDHLQSIPATDSQAMGYVEMAKALKEAPSPAAKRKGVKIQPNIARAVDAFNAARAEADALYHDGQYQEAEAACRKAITLNPNDAGTHFNLDILLQEHLGRFEEAETAYRQAIALDPQDAGLQNNLGNLLRLHLGRFEEAEDAYRQAIALDPENAGFHISLGNLLLDYLGQPQQARQEYSKGLELAPDEPILNANCGYAIALHGLNPEAASVHVARALAIPNGLSVSGSFLLQALPLAGESATSQCQRIGTQLEHALSSNDASLWTDYLDDLQRLLHFVIAQGQGPALQTRMEEGGYAERFAPLYHAFVAALTGADHLLQINPETRQPAQRIYDGLARLLKLYSPLTTKKTK